MTSSLDAFLPAVQTWFRESFGPPTPPQAEGWPAIQRGEHTLILSPTGSGKTLAAFLWGINELYRKSRESSQGQEEQAREKGVRLLYVSPLKALNNDVERNLRAPLAGIRRVAKEQGAPLPRLEVLVRTGDTPQSVRRRMVKHPPHILITTPESLYLILTSPVAREMFRTVRTIIVDEIHTLVGNKRGVHLAVSLERVVEIVSRSAAGKSPGAGSVQRIGLSATQRPLDEVARFLGGYESPSPESVLAPRPVTIVDAGMVKPMDLKVVTAVEDFSELPGGSIWPAVIPQVMDLIEAHHTTLIFANSRRQAERAADRLNDLHLARQAGRGDGPEAMMEGGAVKGIGFQGASTTGGPFRAHHGSVSREARLQLERSLKEGGLPALVGTSSLELGIDIGTVDLVVQLQSPRGVARGLQRVGRSGHLVGQTSAGRFFPTHREDLLESAAIARAMRQGDVEPSYTPQNSLDVLAQQIVAMVSVQDWEVSALVAVLRRAYPYHTLTPDLLRPVLDMLTGRYPSTAFRELRPRIAWDRVHDRLAALPGSRLLAIRNGGTIPDRGSFAAYLPDRKTRLGELDEEFVFETRPGDVFTLGASTWRVQEVTEDRLIVTPAPGYLPRMPFWRGDMPRRDYHLGQIYGRFRRELAERIVPRPATQDGDTDDGADAVDWLQQEFELDIHSARNAVRYVARQMDVLGTISSDRTIVAELFTDPLGDRRLVIHSCLGSRVNSPWALALAQAFREAMGTQPEVMVSDDGILFRFLETDQDPPLDLLREMGPAEARERLLAELPNSAVFGAQFRMNAARALLLPATRGTQKRTPFWLQRLRAKDLLSVAKDFQDFPIVAETYRDCLRDVLDMAHMEEVLGRIGRGEIDVVPVETVVPSPVAASLLYDFINQYMYEWDQPKAERQIQALMVGRDLLSQLLSDASSGVSLPDLLRPEAVRDVDARLQYLADGSRARTPDELSTVFLALGDLSAEEAAARSDGDGAAWVEELVAGGRLVRLDTLAGRYVLAEHADTYRAAFDPAAADETSGDQVAADTSRGDKDRAAARSAEARRAVLRRVLSTHGPLSRDWLLDRYPWEPEWLDAALEALVENGEIVTGLITPTEDGRTAPTKDGRITPTEDGRTAPTKDGRITPTEDGRTAPTKDGRTTPTEDGRTAPTKDGRTTPTEDGRTAPTKDGRTTPTGDGRSEYCDRRNLERIHRQTLSLLRKEIEPVSIYAYADFLTRWQHLHPAERLAGPGALVRLLQQMRGVPAPGIVWERDLLPGRLEAFETKELELLCQQGEVVWVGSGGKDPRRARIRFLFRGEGNLFLSPEPEELDLSTAAGEVLAFLKSEGACFYADLEAGTEWAGDELTSALFELVMAGLVTNDSLDALRGMLAWSAEAEAPGRKPLSSLEAELAAWRKEKPAAPLRSTGRVPPSRARVQAAQRAVARRTAGRGMPSDGSPRWPGRWSLVHGIGVWGREVAYEERIARQARQLLQCYGIVTRQSLEGDSQGGWHWPALYAQFQLMEMRGEVRRGYFVQGLPGVQFALPEAVERLREWTRPPVPAADGPASSSSASLTVDRVEGPTPSQAEGPVLSQAEGLVVVNACDPANLFGPAGVLGETQGNVPDTDPALADEAEAPDRDRPGPDHVMPAPDHDVVRIDPARFTRIPANYVVLLRGKPVLLLEAGGQRAAALPDLPPDTLRRALKLAVDQIGGSVRRLTLSQWNGEQVLDSPAAPLLEEVGFRREALVYMLRPYRGRQSSL